MSQCSKEFVLTTEHNAQVEKSEGHQRNIASTRGQLEAKMDFKVSVVHKELSDLYDQDVEVSYCGCRCSLSKVAHPRNSEHVYLTTAVA